MRRNEINDEYFNWLCGLVSGAVDGHGLTRFGKLLTYLHSVDFSYTHPRDGNRAEDGIALRYRFADEHNYNNAMIATYLDDKPCSVLEMMVALAVRIEDHIMWDPDLGDRTDVWFFIMLDSLGVTHLINRRFDEDEAAYIIDRFLNREYERNGRGGLFAVNTDKHDMRSLEIWYQWSAFYEEEFS